MEWKGKMKMISMMTGKIRRDDLSKDKKLCHPIYLQFFLI